MTEAISNGKTVLIIGNFLSAANGNRGVCEDLAERLRGAGWQVETASSRRSRMARLYDMVTTAWRRRHRYRLAQVDVFSGAAFLWAQLVCAVLRWAHKPYVLTLHGGNLPQYARRRPGRVRRLLQSAAAVTTPSRYLQEQMAGYCSDLHLLPNPLQLNAYALRLRSAAKPRLIWLRAFDAIYNPTLAVRVLALLAADFPDIELIMIGPDKGDGSEQATRVLAEELGLGTHLHMPGRIAKSEVPAWLDRGDVFLNTTNIDNTPISVMEAMACGLCVVTTDVGGMPYLVTDQHNGLLVPPGDAEAMAAAVRRVLTDNEFAERLSAQARRTAEQFDWSVVLPRWEELLTAVGNRKPLAADAKTTATSASQKES